MAKRKKNHKKNDFEMSYYLVAFIDMLGQQELLRNLKKLPDSNKPEENELFFETIKKTYGSVRAMQNSFADFFSGYSKRQPDEEGLTGKQKNIIKQLCNNPIKFQRFSDCIAISLSLRDDVNKVPMRGIYGILGASAITFLTCLARGCPIRGGIDVGLGMEIRKNEIYGPSLSRAYTLESHIAQYPRLVLGEELIQYLHYHASVEPENEHETLRKITSQHCLDLLLTDDDGYPIVDYLGKNLIADNYDELVAKAYKEILKKSVEFQKTKNTKLATRYSKLQGYFEKKVPKICSKYS